MTEALVEAPIITSYKKAAATVGASNGGAFRPFQVAQELSTNTQEALEIFMTPPQDTLFPEVSEFMKKLNASENLDFVIWTQGEMNADAPAEQNNRGFQEVKIAATDILSYGNPVWQDRLEKIELPLVVGGLDKTSEEFFKSIKIKIQAAGYDELVLIDDKPDKVESAYHQLQDIEKSIRVYHLDRFLKEDDPQEFGSNGHVVKDLLGIEWGSGRVLVLCDFDGTLSDTKKIKQDHERRLLKLSRQS